MLLMPSPGAESECHIAPVLYQGPDQDAWRNGSMMIAPKAATAGTA
jgi:hypothetical protein